MRKQVTPRLVSVPRPLSKVWVNLEAVRIIKRARKWLTPILPPQIFGGGRVTRGLFFTFYQARQRDVKSIFNEFIVLFITYLNPIISREDPDSSFGLLFLRPILHCPILPTANSSFNKVQFFLQQSPILPSRTVGIIVSIHYFWVCTLSTILSHSQNSIMQD
jgi:hypothetical protein